MIFRPIQHEERFYIAPNHSAICFLTGFMCRIRGTFGADGYQLQTTVFPDSKYLSAEGIDPLWNSLRQAFTILRTGEICNKFLANRNQMNVYCKDTATSENTTSAGFCSYGFRFDYDLYTYMICCYPNKMAYDFDIYMYVSRKLDDHLEKCRKDICIANTTGKVMLRVKEGSRVRLITHGGESRDMTIRFAGYGCIVTEAEWGKDHYQLDEFAKKFARHGCKDIFLLPQSDTGMTKKEFAALIGKDLVVDYPFGRELQRWSMKNFYVDEDGNVRHKRITSMLTDGFIANARNPHWGKATHG